MLKATVTFSGETVTGKGQRNGAAHPCSCAACCRDPLTLVVVLSDIGQISRVTCRTRYVGVAVGIKYSYHRWV